MCASRAKQLVLDHGSAQPLPKQVPWASSAEWWSVMHAVLAGVVGLADSVEGALAHIERACARIALWEVRGNVPSAVSATRHLAQLLLQRNPSQLEMGLVLIRAVNGLVDPYQRARGHARSIASIAHSVGLPKLVVDLRHKLTHQHMPSRALLRMGCRTMLYSLLRGYWWRTRAVLVGHNTRVRECLADYLEAVDVLCAQRPSEHHMHVLPECDCQRWGQELARILRPHSPAGAHSAEVKDASSPRANGTANAMEASLFASVKMTTSPHSPAKRVKTGVSAAQEQALVSVCVDPTLHLQSLNAMYAYGAYCYIIPALCEVIRRRDLWDHAWVCAAGQRFEGKALHLSNFGASLLYLTPAVAQLAGKYGMRFVSRLCAALWAVRGQSSLAENWAGLLIDSVALSVQLRESAGSRVEGECLHTRRECTADLQTRSARLIAENGVRFDTVSVWEEETVQRKRGSGSEVFRVRLRECVAKHMLDECRRTGRTSNGGVMLPSARLLPVTRWPVSVYKDLVNDGSD